ncbi:MAG: hypothetical protein MJY70_04895 [Bacteroidales bacterium]|nr:hypothetical protein [Bacteroidales bacterium]
MKRALYLIASAVLLLTGCAKEELGYNTASNGETVEVNIETSLSMSNPVTKAVWDKDGNAAYVDHWIMEVYDKDEALYYRKELTGQTGLTKTFTVTLIKNQEYSFVFWADRKGSYETSKLTDIKAVLSSDSRQAGKDSLDAFFCKKPYKSTKSESVSAVLKRPFGQVNIVTLDTKKIYDVIKDDTVYSKFIPEDLKVTARVYNGFNALADTLADLKQVDLTELICYGKTPYSYAEHKDTTTLFMDYLFVGDEQQLVDLAFEFKSNGEKFDYTFASVPLKRNYRTNIMGNLLSNDAEWTVTVDPIWNQPDFDVPVLPKGALPGAFSVSADKKVRFAKGNLRAQKVEDTWTWGFYDKQYLCNLDKGTSNRKAQASDDGIDLFTWGYGAWSKDPITTTYASSSFVDWGTVIEGDADWRTLSVEEWEYLVNKEGTSTVRKNKFKCGVTVCGLKNCMILAPDDFAGAIEASYDTESWKAAEAKGLVCLPPAGTRYETDIYFISVYGYYWTSSKEDDKALLVSFDDKEPFPGICFDDALANGFAVRLVTDYK